MIVTVRAAVMPFARMALPDWQEPNANLLLEEVVDNDVVYGAASIIEEDPVQRRRPESARKQLESRDRTLMIVRF